MLTMSPMLISCPPMRPIIPVSQKNRENAALRELTHRARQLSPTHLFALRRKGYVTLNAGIDHWLTPASLTQTNALVNASLWRARCFQSLSEEEKVVILLPVRNFLGSVTEEKQI